MLVVFSKDKALINLVRDVLPSGWKFESHDRINACREVLSHPNIRVVIVDDEGIEEDLRGWLLYRIRHYVSQSMLIYVASCHSVDDEKRARSYSARYYAAKPLDFDRTHRVLESFLRASVECYGRDAR